MNDGKSAQRVLRAPELHRTIFLRSTAPLGQSTLLLKSAMDRRSIVPRTNALKLAHVVVQKEAAQFSLDLR